MYNCTCSHVWSLYSAQLLLWPPASSVQYTIVHTIPFTMLEGGLECCGESVWRSCVCLFVWVCIGDGAEQVVYCLDWGEVVGYEGTMPLQDEVRRVRCVWHRATPGCGEKGAMCWAACPSRMRWEGCAVCGTVPIQDEKVRCVGHRAPPCRGLKGAMCLAPCPPTSKWEWCDVWGTVPLHVEVRRVRCVGHRAAPRWSEKVPCVGHRTPFCLTLFFRWSILE